MGKNKKQAPKKNFRTAVEATSDVKTCFKKGLTGLGVHSIKVSVSDTSKLQGSLNIDDCTVKIYPGANRWDYAFSYQGEVFFVEVHSANTGEVSTVLKKLRWLKDWLQQYAPKINELKAKSRTPFYWVQTGRFAILPTSSQYKQIAQAGMMPISKLTLP